jgi:DNA-directed RNA polymerase subunit RPC12/RpoP
MDTAYAAVCLLCGRTLGAVVGKRFFPVSSGRSVRREGRQLRCGYCGGTILLEPDPTVSPT